MSEEQTWIRPFHGHLVAELARGLEAAVHEGTELTALLLRDAWRERTTDIHLDPQGPGMLVRLRIDGALLDALVLDRETGERLVRHLKVAAGLDVSTTFKPEDARITHDLGDRRVDMRLAFTPSVRGLKLSIRLLDPSRIRHRMGTLGLTKTGHKRIRDWMVSGSGAFVVSGPTGGGKTTTLYAVLQELTARPCSVITVEDPVEYRVDGVVQIQADPEHGLTLAAALKAMLRLDPDYLFLGEIRDSESARTALSAAASGRALLTTMHARDAVSTVTALRNHGLSDYEISTTLELVVAQRLVRRLCSSCSHPQPIGRRARRWLEAMHLPMVEHTWMPQGCERCRGLGYRGRIGLFETWRLEPDDHQAILARADERTMRDALARRRHRTILIDGYKKVLLGITSLAELSTVSLPALPPVEIDLRKGEAVAPRVPRVPPPVPPPVPPVA